jgi:hypothetical protein
MKNYPTVIPVDGTLAFGHTFVSKDGARLTPRWTPIQIWWMRLAVEVQVVIETGAVALMCEVVAHILLDKERNIISESKIMVRVLAGVSAVRLEAYFSAKLKGSSQIWSNPFGMLPHMAIVFPLALSIGFTLEYAAISAGAPVPIPYLFEFEAGILACGTPVEYKVGLSTRDYTSLASLTNFLCVILGALTSCYC